MAGLSAGERASEALLARKEELARRITAITFEADPRLLHRFGEAGRAKCLEDMHYTLEHLAPALALEEPGLFAGYVRWLVKLMASLGIPSTDVQRTLDALRDVLGTELAADEAEVALRTIEAGRAVAAEAA